MTTEHQPSNFDQLWDYNQPALSEERFRQRLQTVEPTAALYAEILTQLARAQGLQRKFSEAHQTLDQAQTLLDALPTQPSTRARLRAALERGRVFNSARQPEQARPLFLQVWEEAQTVGEDFYAVDAAHMLGIIEPPDQQLAWHQKALALAEQSNDPRTKKWLGSLYNNIGWTYHDLQQYEAALAIFQKALAWRRPQGQPRETQIAEWSVARLLRALDRVPEAYTIQQDLLTALEQNGETDGYVQEELGECLLLLQRPVEAQSHFAAAYQLLAQDAWLVENEPARLERLGTLGKVIVKAA
ncbi:MAG: tetratricopeptide repeat protein [Chloroflexi bacterium]|nr:tetratricopeptide repeat protein [Chloroflexota bacterium]